MDRPVYLKWNLSFVSYSSKVLEVGAAIAAVSVWLAISITLFLTHGRQDFCLTKQLLLICHTGLCICLVLASLTPCARSPLRNWHARYASTYKVLGSENLISKTLR